MPNKITEVQDRYEHLQLVFFRGDSYREYFPSRASLSRFLDVISKLYEQDKVLAFGNRMGSYRFVVKCGDN